VGETSEAATEPSETSVAVTWEVENSGRETLEDSMEASINRALRSVGETRVGETQKEVRHQMTETTLALIRVLDKQRAMITRQ
jgi:hypothetical protein